MLKLAFSKL